MANQKTMQELGAEPGALPDWALGLTPRKLAFLQEYLVDFNGRRAALRAQLSQTDAGASSVAKNLLRDPDVTSALARAMSDTVQARLALRQRIIEELSCIAFYDVSRHVVVRANTIQLTDTEELTEDERRAVKRYKQTTGEKSESLEVELHDKVKAAELLAKINGDLSQGGSSVTINNQPVTNDKVLVFTPDEMRALGNRPKK